MKKSHDCKEVVEQFNMLLDGSLNAKQEQDVMCELQRCMHCLQEYNLEDKYRSFIKDKVERKCANESFIGKLKDCIKGL